MIKPVILFEIMGFSHWPCLLQSESDCDCSVITNMGRYIVLLIWCHYVQQSE